ncbi:MAG: helix-turn-helix domain-containing protein [Bryobacter sp.]|jgi:excisionase family DNA binding protein|nr:helix-turn-helix domain-containing protein [Bryobacter sp. CoA8 C33]
MDTKLPPLERLLTPRDVAHWLGVSVDWVQDHATSKEPRLPCVRMGKLLRFRREDVEAFLSERLVRRPVAFSRDLRLRDVAKR